MSSAEIDLREVPLLANDPESLRGDWDRVVANANNMAHHHGQDSPNGSAPGRSTPEPWSEATAPTDAMRDQREARRAEIDRKHARLVEFLETRGLEGLVLCRGDSLAWFTAGGDLSGDLGQELGAAAIYVTPRARALICDNVQGPRLFDTELDGLGFQLKERPWHEEPLRVLDELTRGRRVAGDQSLLGWTNLRGPLIRLRLCLEPEEQARIRQLGRDLTTSVEEVARRVTPGLREHEIAGMIAASLYALGITPIALHVAVDGRIARHRHAKLSDATLADSATLSVSGRRDGLHASVSRTIHFGPIDPTLRAAHALSAMIEATDLFFARDSESIAEVFRRARRIFEKYQAPHEWHLSYQGFLTGYAPRELLLTPQTNLTLEAGMILTWCPSVGPGLCQSTMLVGAERPEVLTQHAPNAPHWPELEIQIKGETLKRPAILERPR